MENKNFKRIKYTDYLKEKFQDKIAKSSKGNDQPIFTNTIKRSKVLK